RLALCKRADSPDDFTCTLAVGDDVAERCARFRDIGRHGGKPARACSSAGDHRAQWLADFVCNRGGQLAERGQVRHVSKLGPGHLQRMIFSAQPLLRELAFADIASEGKLKALVALSELADANLDREGDAILAP